MAFDSFAHVPLTDEVLAHIWDGEPGDVNQGGHRYGLGREGKTEFPEDWSADRTRKAVMRVLAHPHSVIHHQQKVICLGLIADVIIEVRLSINADGLFLQTAFPVCGVGVFQNVRGSRQARPLDIAILEV